MNTKEPGTGINEESKIFEIASERDFIVYLDSVTYWSSHYSNLLLENIPIRSNLRVLDVATGPGIPLIELAQRLGRSSEVIGIDILDRAIAEASRKINLLGLTNAKAVKADAYNLPFGPEAFDYVISCIGINNVVDKDKMFKEMSRVNKRAGLLMLATNLETTMSEFYDVYFKVLKEFANQDYLDKLREQRGERVSVKILDRLYKDNGYRVTKRVKRVLSFSFLNADAFFAHEFIKMGFVKNWENIVSSDQDRAIIFERIKKKINERVKDAKGFKITVPYMYIEGKKLG